MVQLNVEQRNLVQFSLDFALSRIDSIAEQLAARDYPCDDEHCDDVVGLSAHARRTLLSGRV